MEAVMLLVPVSLALSLLFVILCIKAIIAGQFDDLESPRWRILFDGDHPGRFAEPGFGPSPEVQSGEAGAAFPPRVPEPAVTSIPEGENPWNRP